MIRIIRTEYSSTHSNRASAHVLENIIEKKQPFLFKTFDPIYSTEIIDVDPFFYREYKNLFSAAGYKSVSDLDIWEEKI